MPSPIRLLLLEDTLADAELIMRELKRAALNVEIRRVDTEREFRQQLTESYVDVILADYSLPSFDGEAALEIAHELVPETPFIFVSGSIGEERAIAALHNGATDYILKDRLSRLGPAVKRALGAVKDITERRRAEQELRESEVRFRSVAESAADAILLTESDCTIIFANERAAAMFDVPAHDLVGKDAENLLADDVRAEIDGALNALLSIDSNEPKSLTMATVGMRRDGTEFPIEISVSTWKRDGRTFLTEILRDVTSRVAAERRQRTQFEVTKLLAASRSVNETMPELIRLLAQGLGWRGGVIWLLDPATRRLGCTGAWIQDEHHAEAIIKACSESTFAEGEGLPGRALLTNLVSETLLLNASQNDALYHATVAAVGIPRATAVPLRMSGAAVGVIEFFELEGPKPDAAMLAVTVDIAGQVAQYVDRMRSEEARLAATERLREAQHLAHVGNWVYDLVTRKTLWSEEVFAVFGVDAEHFEPSFHAYVAAIHPDDRERVLSILRTQTKDCPETIRFECRIVRPDGSERTIECRSRILLDEIGAIVRAIGTVQDITEQAEAARTIEELSLRSEMILDCAAEGIIGVSRDASIMFVNPAALSILGRSRDELGDCRDTHELFHHTKADGTPYPASECPVLMTLTDGKKRTVTGEFFWRRDGSRFAVEFECAPIFENDAIKGCVLTFRDVTESLALQRQLDLARRIGSLGRVAATIAHEFNNVLMGINPFAEMILRSAKSDEKILKAAEQISISVRRGRRVTEEILRFTQPAEPALQTINVREWMRNLEPELHALAGAGTGVTVLVPNNPVYAACDAAQLQQVIANLLLNARDASPEGGEVLIALETRPDGFLEIIVRDNGPGIPTHTMEAIFEPLFTTKRNGTGLGLSVVRQIVTQHGGTISVTNPAGGGAEFRIAMPLSDPMLVADSPPAEVRTENTFRRLLIVEDDESVSSGMATLLEMEGLVVRVTDRGAAVVEAITSFRPDAVILDLTLPDIDGTEVFRRVRERWPKLPVVFSTGHGGEIELGYALDRGRVALLRKPYDIHELLAALRRVSTPATEAA
jgi:PAS domain S-box-containing protein